jgi:hypothetical protein
MGTVCRSAAGPEPGAGTTGQRGATIVTNGARDLPAERDAAIYHEFPQPVDAIFSTTTFHVPS